LAFYVQYDANRQQRALFEEQQRESIRQFDDQIKIQKAENLHNQFESQFYEMLRLHRENITEMKISGYDFDGDKKVMRFDKVTEGRKVFVTMKTELECIIEIYTANVKALNHEGFKKCYRLFFWGLKDFKKSNPEDVLFIKKCEDARTQHVNKEKKIIDNDKRKDFESVELKFNYKPFSGHASRLGHYFRHLYMTVKFVVESKVIPDDYDGKMKYLRILRGQLSNHEQILMFYNWLGDFGVDWENDEQQFFTEYCMIHNLWHQNLYEDKFILDQVEWLRNRPVTKRKGEMFEMG
jgi:hypothetical protein